MLIMIIRICDKIILIATNHVKIILIFNKSRKNRTHISRFVPKMVSFLCLESSVQSVYNPIKVFSSRKYISEWG